MNNLKDSYNNVMNQRNRNNIYNKDMLSHNYYNKNHLLKNKHVLYNIPYVVSANKAKIRSYQKLIKNYPDSYSLHKYLSKLYIQYIETLDRYIHIIEKIKNCTTKPDCDNIKNDYITLLKAHYRAYNKAYLHLNKYKIFICKDNIKHMECNSLNYNLNHIYKNLQYSKNKYINNSIIETFSSYTKSKYEFLYIVIIIIIILILM